MRQGEENGSWETHGVGLVSIDPGRGKGECKVADDGRDGRKIN